MYSTRTVILFQKKPRVPNTQQSVYCITEVAPERVEQAAQAGLQLHGVPARLLACHRIKYTSMYPPPPLLPSVHIGEQDQPGYSTVQIAAQ